MPLASSLTRPVLGRLHRYQESSQATVISSPPSPRRRAHVRPAAPRASGSARRPCAPARLALKTSSGSRGAAGRARTPARAPAPAAARVAAHRGPPAARAACRRVARGARAARRRPASAGGAARRRGAVVASPPAGTQPPASARGMHSGADPAVSPSASTYSLTARRAGSCARRRRRTRTNSVTRPSLGADALLVGGLRRRRSPSARGGRGPPRSARTPSCSRRARR